jgi:hypothetical protein
MGILGLGFWETFRDEDQFIRQNKSGVSHANYSYVLPNVFEVRTRVD